MLPQVNVGKASLSKETDQAIVAKTVTRRIGNGRCIIDIHHKKKIHQPGAGVYLITLLY